MKKDYSELEGKIIDWVYTSGKTVKGKVIGCNYDIGITIVKEDNPTFFLSCYNGKYSPFFKGKRNIYSGSIYRKAFFNRIKEIKAGISTFKIREQKRKESNSVNTRPTNIHCAFTQ